VSLVWGVAAAGAVLAATSAYSYVEGVRFWRDLADELLLRRLELEALDRAWAASTTRSDAIVTMTTIPSRMALIGETLKSLLRQTRAPARIVINVPHVSRREQREYEIPAYLERLASVEIHRCDDWGPATKLIPSLLRFPAGQKLVVADDDRIYPPNLVEDLERASAAHPGCAIGLGGWRVPDDLTDRPTTLWADLRGAPPVPVKATRLRKAVEVDILQGMASYLVQTDFFDSSEVTDYSAAPEAVFFVDDVWLSGHCKAVKLVVPAARINYEPMRNARYFKSTSVALINRGDGTPESRNNTVAIRHLRHAWLCTKVNRGDRGVR
jgi:hypothetical protein